MLLFSVMLSEIQIFQRKSDYYKDFFILIVTDFQYIAVHLHPLWCSHWLPSVLPPQLSVIPAAMLRCSLSWQVLRRSFKEDSSCSPLGLGCKYGLHLLQLYKKLPPFLHLCKCPPAKGTVGFIVVLIIEYLCIFREISQSETAMRQVAKSTYGSTDINIWKLYPKQEVLFFLPKQTHPWISGAEHCQSEGWQLHVCAINVL